MGEPRVPPRLDVRMLVAPRAPHRLHYLYGSLSLLAVLSPWLYAPHERRSRLAWFAGATLAAGALAVRAYMTGT